MSASAILLWLVSAAVAISPAEPSQVRVVIVGPDFRTALLADTIARLLQSRHDERVTVSTARSPSDLEAGPAAAIAAVVVDAAAPDSVAISSPDDRTGPRQVRVDAIDPVAAETIAQIVGEICRQLREHPDADSKRTTVVEAPPPATLAVEARPPIGALGSEPQWEQAMGAAYVVRSVFDDRSFASGQAPAERGFSAFYALSRRDHRGRPGLRLQVERSGIPAGTLNRAGPTVTSLSLNLTGIRVAAGASWAPWRWTELRVEIGGGFDRLAAQDEAVWLSAARGTLTVVIPFRSPSIDLYAGVSVDLRTRAQLAFEVVNGGAVPGFDPGLTSLAMKRIQPGAALGLAWRLP